MARVGVAMAGELRPDLVVLDISMPGMSGVEALTKITAASPTHKGGGRVRVRFARGWLRPRSPRARSACLDKGVGPNG